MPKRAAPPLTDPVLKKEKPGSRPIDIRDGMSRGLIFTVLPSGAKSFSVRYVWQGKHRRLVLGTYPALTLAKAREAAEDMRSAIRSGRDPVGERHAAKAVRTDTVRALADEYLRLHARKKKRTADEDDRILNVYVLPKWGDRSVREITRRDVRELLDHIAERAPIMANRTLEIIRKMFNFGIMREWLDGNPASRIDKPGVERARERVLDDDEIRALWSLLSRFPATDEKQAPNRKRATVDANGQTFCPLSPGLAAVQKLRLLTAQRGGEVIRMRWADLDLEAGWWTVPAGHSKNGIPHRVALSNEAIDIIAAQQPDADQRKGDVFAGRGGAIPIERVKKAGAACAKALGIADMHSHDLRRTAATRMAKLGIPSAHISHVLNHVAGGPKATRVYDRHDYDREKRVALDAWARELRAILDATPRTGAAILPIAKRA